MEQYIAAWQGDLGTLRDCLETKKQANMNKKCKVEKIDKGKYQHLSGKSMLYLACQKGHSDIVEYLLSLGADPTTHTKIGEAIKTHTMFNGSLRHRRNALHAAILYAHPECIDALLRHSGEKLVNSEGRLLKYSWMGRFFGSTWSHKFYPLHLACYTLSPEVTKQLCEMGAKPDLKETSKGYTPFLCLFNSRERMEVVGYKDLRHISSEEGRNRESRLNMVAQKEKSGIDQRQIVDILIQHGANRHAQDKDDRNAVHLASADMNIEMLQYLITLGVSPHTIDAHGNTPLHNILVLNRYCDDQLQWERWIDVVKVLIAAGVDMDARNAAGKTALHLCAESRNATANLVRELVAMGADVSILDKSGMSPLFLAATSQESEETIQEFLRHPKSDYKFVDRQGNTLYHYLARNKHKTGNVIQECVGLGLDINAQNNKSWTALHIVAAKGTVESAQGFIGNGANVNAKDNSGNTPLHLAEKNELSFAMTEALCNGGADITLTNNSGQPTMKPNLLEHFSKGKT